MYKYYLKKTTNIAGHWWLMLVIIATLEGRDQEDRGLKAAQANSSQDPILKKTQHKIGLEEWFKR
jgi:hypothetical protein